MSSQRSRSWPVAASTDVRGTEALVSDRVRLTATEWAKVEHAPVTVEGLDAARSMFLG